MMYCIFTLQLNFNQTYELPVQVHNDCSGAPFLYSSVASVAPRLWFILYKRYLLLHTFFSCSVCLLVLYHSRSMLTFLDHHKGKKNLANSIEYCILQNFCSRSIQNTTFPQLVFIICWNCPCKLNMSSEACVSRSPRKTCCFSYLRSLDMPDCTLALTLQISGEWKVNILLH